MVNYATAACITLLECAFDCNHTFWAALHCSTFTWVHLQLKDPQGTMLKAKLN